MVDELGINVIALPSTRAGIPNSAPEIQIGNNLILVLGKLHPMQNKGQNWEIEQYGMEVVEIYLLQAQRQGAS